MIIDMIWTDQYFIRKLTPYTYEVTKFGDTELPERFATVNIRNRSVNFGFRYSPTIETITKYVGLVELYIEHGEPTGRCYMFESDGYRWRQYGEYKEV